MAGVEDLVNEALPPGVRPIGWIYEGSKAAIAALAIYGQTRDEILAAREWPFARRGNVALVLLKGPPPAGGYNPSRPWASTDPPPGWLYEYAYPPDMLKLGGVLFPPGAMFDLDPRPAVARVDNDNQLTPPQKIILSNIAGALASYTARVTDPLLWEPGFRMALIEALGQKLALRLGTAPAKQPAEGATPAERARG